MARNVRQIRRKGKQLGLVPTPVATAPSLDSRVALIQALIPGGVGAGTRGVAGGSGGLGRRAVCARGPATRARALDAAGRVHLSRRSEDPDCGAAGARPAAESGSAPADLHAAPTASGGGRGPAPQGPGRPLDAGVRTVRRSGPRGVWAERLDGLAALHPRPVPASCENCRTAGWRAMTWWRSCWTGRPSPRTRWSRRSA